MASALSEDTITFRNICMVQKQIMTPSPYYGSPKIATEEPLFFDAGLYVNFIDANPNVFLG